MDVLPVLGIPSIVKESGDCRMKLVSFSVENYRSITNARRIPLSNYSVLIGPNNEGKSNILHALALGMHALQVWHRMVTRGSDGRIIRRRYRSISHYQNHFDYNWDIDFPITKQNTNNKYKKTNILLEFELDDLEIEEFKNDINSSLNGSLPINISFNEDGTFDITVKKQGKGGKSLNKKSNKIAYFVSRRIRFEYIPSIRTAKSATNITSGLVEQELSKLEDNEDYISAIKKIEEIQKPVLDKLGNAIQETIAKFLPNVKSVKISVPRNIRLRTLRREVEIKIDDGSETSLERKGDGVQSLVALALMRYASEISANQSSTIIAIEEPESHLHPKAIHELRKVIKDLSERNQIVLTSHSPLFVDPTQLRNTIIVNQSRANIAKKIYDVRTSLGVQSSDNLVNAHIIILVEGVSDQKALQEIIQLKSKSISDAIKSGIIRFESLGGVSSLRQKASFYRSITCIVRCFIDNDKEAIKAAERAIKDCVLENFDITFAKIPGKVESELEDFYDSALYADSFHSEFKINIRSNIPKAIKTKKWTDVIEYLFNRSGRMWNHEVEVAIKSWMAEFAINHKDNIIRKEISSALNAFVHNIEDTIKNI